MNEIILAVSLVALIFLIPIIVAKVEKRRTWPYVRQYEFGNFQLSPVREKYVSKCVYSAESEGFTYLERRYDGKGKKYKIIYEFMISSDRNTLAIIGAGSIVSIPVKSMWFISKDVNLNCFTTVTHQDAVEYDLSGHYKDSLIMTNDFGKAFHYHLECVAKNLYHVEPFTENSEIDVLKHMKELKIDRMNKDGWIKYVGQDKDYWRYTVRGAVELVVCQIIQGVIRFPKSLLMGSLKTKK